jgi:hypothetical protein
MIIVGGTRKDMDRGILTIELNPPNKMPNPARTNVGTNIKVVKSLIFLSFITFLQ